MTDNLLQISVDQALHNATTLPLDQFITMAQSMAFNVSPAPLPNSFVQQTDFSRLLQLIQTTEDVNIVFATIGFRRLLSSEKNPPI